MEKKTQCEARTYDAVILGFGKGGKTLAADLAKHGKKVALIEKSNRMYGGTCINVGCIPSKSLVHSAQMAFARGEGEFSVKAEQYWKAMAEKERVTGMLREKNYKKLADLPNVDVIDGTGSFLDSRHILVKMPHGQSKADLVLESQQIFINTGSTAVIPSIAGIQGNSRVYFSETLLDLKELPKRLVIIGGGYIGLEFASFYTNFGSKVTVIQDGPRFLPREDQDMADEIKSAFEARGVEFLLSANTKEIREQGKEAIVDLEYAGKPLQLTADAVLVATGRRPNTDGLNLEKAGIQTTSRGAVETDELRRTSVAGIWAMGDVVGELQFTYVSLDDYRIVSSQLFPERKLYAATDRKNVPYSVFIEPAFSRVGINQQEAAAKGLSVKILKLPAAAVPKAQVLKETKGMLKAVVDEVSGQILGAMLFCAESYEMINLVKLAMDWKIPASALANQVYTHPTMSEGFNDLFSM